MVEKSQQKIAGSQTSRDTDKVYTFAQGSQISQSIQDLPKSDKKLNTQEVRLKALTQQKFVKKPIKKESNTLPNKFVSTSRSQSFLKPLVAAERVNSEARFRNDTRKSSLKSHVVTQHRQSLGNGSQQSDVDSPSKLSIQRNYYEENLSAHKRLQFQQYFGEKIDSTLIGVDEMDTSNLNVDLVNVTKDVQMLLRQSSHLSEIALDEAQRQLSHGTGVTVESQINNLKNRLQKDNLKQIPKKDESQGSISILNKTLQTER